jgi:hypothetical protein
VNEETRAGLGTEDNGGLREVWQHPDSLMKHENGSWGDSEGVRILDHGRVLREISYLAYDGIQIRLSTDGYIASSLVSSVD